MTDVVGSIERAAVEPLRVTQEHLLSFLYSLCFALWKNATRSSNVTVITLCRSVPASIPSDSFSYLNSPLADSCVEQACPVGTPSTQTLGRYR